jgi:hypothetical protein
MKKNNWLISWFLLLSVVGLLNLTTPDWVGCHDFYPDEFLDLGLLSQDSILPLFASRLNTNPSNLFFVKKSGFQKITFLATVLRC